MSTLIDLRHLDAPKTEREPEFLPPDPEDVRKARAVKDRIRIERLIEQIKRDPQRPEKQQ